MKLNGALELPWENKVKTLILYQPCAVLYFVTKLFAFSGKSFFRGPWLLTPPEVPGTISRLFYRQEVMLSTVQETTPTVAIVGRCAVLEQHEYVTSMLALKLSTYGHFTPIPSSFAGRPTEIAEADVFLCESVYDELKKQIRKAGALKKFTHTQMVTQDEIYHFRRAINPPKVGACFSRFQFQIAGVCSCVYVCVAYMCGFDSHRFS